MAGLRNSDMVRGIDIINTYNIGRDPDVLPTQLLKGTLYIVGSVQPSGYVESTYTMETYTPAVYTASEFDAGAADLAAAIASYVASTNVPATYVASQYSASTHDFERITVSRVLIGSEEQDILLDNQGKVVWMSDAVRPDGTLNEPIIVENLI